MQEFDDTRFELDGEDVLGVLGLLAGAGEEIVAEPENLEGTLRKMVAGLRTALGLRALSLSASVGEGRRISATGPPCRCAKGSNGYMLICSRF